MVREPVRPNNSQVLGRLVRFKRMTVMKSFLTALAVVAATVGAADVAEAQWYSSPAPYGWSSYRGFTPYSTGYSPYYGSYSGTSYYPGGYGVQTFSYDATLPGGGVYGYSYRRPGYFAAYRSPSYGYAPVYPGYYYRPGYYVWFNN